jgi:hypothetical protein
LHHIRAERVPLRRVVDDHFEDMAVLFVPNARGLQIAHEIILLGVPVKD